MKHLFALALIFISFQAISQVAVTAPANITNWSLCSSQSQTIKTTDSVVVSSTLTSTNQFGSITWKISSPSVIIPNPVISWLTGVSATSTITLKNLPVGTYTITATGTDKSGISGLVTTTVTVTPPVPGRTLVGGTIKVVNGVLTIVPTYSDGQP